jgi:hypothetical protein
MKIPLLITALVVTFSTLSYAQDSVRIALPDSTQRKSIAVTPYYKQEIRSSGSYIKKIEDADLLRFSSGLSIFNVLRGQVPGLVISPYAVMAVPGFRYEYWSQKNASVLIDGIPFNASITSYLNFNASEFSTIAAIPSANSLSFLDLPTTGAISLTSKSGEGYDKPAFEYNTNVLAGWEEVNSRTGSFTEKDWNLYNTLSYSQDFGRLDMRASYSAMNSWLKPGSIKSPMSHFLKLNAGYKLGDQGEVRTIVSALLRKREISYSPFSMPAEVVNEELNQRFLTGNISAKYGLNDWLTVTGQISVSTHDSLFNRESSQFSYSRHRKDGQVQANTYIVANRSTGSPVEISGFAGVQHTIMKISLNDFTGTGEQRFGRTYLSGGSEIGYKKYLFTNMLLKVPVSQNDKLNYSISGSFVFSELFKNLPMTFGKARGSFGRNHFTDYATYPWQRSAFIISRSLVPVTSLEWGADFSFVDNRLLVSLIRFNDKWEVNFPGISEIERKGFEGDVSYLFVRKPNANLKTGAVFSFINDDDFRGSLLVQLTRGRSFISIMAERVSITTLYTGTQSFTRLRDITIGQSIGQDLSSKYWLSQINIGICARNVYDFNSSRFTDYEQQNFAFIKSVNVNISLEFK